VSDLDTIDYGMVLDLVIEYGNDFEGAASEKQETVKMATQADMDLFARG
jgi:hypothetical protein